MDKGLTARYIKKRASHWACQLLAWTVAFYTLFFAFMWWEYHRPLPHPPVRTKTQKTGHKHTDTFSRLDPVTQAAIIAAGLQLQEVVIAGAGSE